MVELWISFIDLLTKFSWLHGLAQVIVVIVVIIFIFKNVIVPSWYFLNKLWKRFYKLLDISSQFENNGGSTLRDKIDLIVKTTEQTNKDIKIVNGKVITVMGLLGSYNEGIGMYEASIEGDYLLITKRWTDLTGLSFREAEGNGWINSIAEENRAKVFEAWTNAILQDRDFDIEYRLHNGVRVINHAQVIRDEHGSPLRYIGTIVPIAELQNVKANNITL